MLATLVVGLREDSRIVRKLSGDKIPRGDILLAAVVDRLSMIVWMLSDNGANGTNRPKSIVEALLGTPKTESSSDVKSFDSPEEFKEAYYKRTGVRLG